MSTSLAPSITEMVQTPASNPNPTINNFLTDHYDDLGFGLLSDYLAFEDQQEDDYTCNFNTSPPWISPVILQENNEVVLQENNNTSTESSLNSNHEDMNNSSTHVLQTNKCSKRVKRSDKSDNGSKIAFRIKTELEILDDGYKWRKYGKKMVKNNPNPRNYYKCSSVGCQVKKRVERDLKDSSYVIASYEGIHNHETPHSFIYCNTHMQFD